MDMVRFFWPMYAQYVDQGLLSYDEAVDEIIMVAHGEVSHYATCGCDATQVHNCPDNV